MIYFRRYESKGFFKIDKIFCFLNTLPPKCQIGISDPCTFLQGIQHTEISNIFCTFLIQIVPQCTGTVKKWTPLQQLAIFFAEFSLLMYIWHLAFYGNTNESNKVRGIVLHHTIFTMPSNLKYLTIYTQLYDIC